MGMLDKISKSLVDYVSLSDLIGFLSEYQNETIHDIALYLSHYNFYDTPNYSITVDNKFHKNDFDDFGNYIGWFEPKNIIDNLIKEFVFFDTVVSRSMIVEMTFSKIRHYLSKMNDIEIGNEQYLAIEKLQRANIHYKKSDLLELDFLSEYLQNNQEFKEWETAYIRPFSDFDNQWYIAQPAITTDPTTLQTQLDQAHARIAELEQQLANAPNQATRSQKDEHISELESQTSELKGLALHNHNIAKAKAFAQIIAKSIWDMDENQQIKTGDMVQYIKGLLLKFDQKNLPQNDETLADWLKDVKPTYATKGGRPPKDAPNKITLTFKK